jgi:hypothetical protein
MRGTSISVIFLLALFVGGQLYGSTFHGPIGMPDFTGTSHGPIGMPDFTGTSHGPIGMPDFTNN